MENTKIILSDKQFMDYCRQLEQLEVDRIYCKHSLEHFVDVARIAYIRVLEEKIDVSKDIVYATALLHDVGRVLEVVSGISHEVASVTIAKNILNRTHFTQEEKERILGCIAHHRTKEKALDSFYNVFYEADKQSRLCFKCPAYDLCYWPSEKKNHTIIY